MITRKHYLIQLVDSDGSKFWLRKDCKGFHWHNHGNDKEYKSLNAARLRAQRILRTLRRHNNASSAVSVVEVTFEPCTPELPDGFYKPVERVVCEFL